MECHFWPRSKDQIRQIIVFLWARTYRLCGNIKLRRKLNFRSGKSTGRQWLAKSRMTLYLSNHLLMLRARLEMQIVLFGNKNYASIFIFNKLELFLETFVVLQNCFEQNLEEKQLHVPKHFSSSSKIFGHVFLNVNVWMLFFLQTSIIFWQIHYGQTSFLQFWCRLSVFIM